MKFRRILLWLHRWVGVVAGLIILFAAITGGVLVFQHTQDRWLNPELFPREATAAENRAPVIVALDEVRQKHPDMRVQGIRLPRDEHDALTLIGGNRMVQCDPRTGAILGIRPRMNLWWQTFVKLHVNLMLGPTGGLVVEIATWITLGLALTGLWLWWPLRIFGFRKGASFRRFNLDLHSVAGLYSSLFLIVVCITGLTMRHLHLEHPRSPGSHAPQAGAQRINVDTAIQAAEKALPGAKAAAVEIPPPNPQAAFRIQLAFPEDGSPAGRSVAFVDQWSGQALAVHSAREGGFMERYDNLQLSLHIGAVGGTATRWIALFVCVALALQIFSGYVLWWKRAA
jgi:uncharacterized iron-regulated membrane protein